MNGSITQKFWSGYLKPILKNARTLTGEDTAQSFWNKLSTSTLKESNNLAKHLDNRANILQNML
eukprot:5166068-Karenia_brevis.AAC.1